jgi:hypothetical protein
MSVTDAANPWGVAQCRKGAQNRHAYLRQTSDWHLPDTDGIKVPAWLGRCPLAHGLPHLSAGHKTYYFTSQIPHLLKMNASSQLRDNFS